MHAVAGGMRSAAVECAMQNAPTPVLGSMTPRLGGSQTPLVGKHKVEVMMGIKRDKGDGVKAENDSSSMPPPRARNYRK